jgi:predicted ABC-type ATPase
VLSTDKYRALVTEAKRLGFEIRLIYVLLNSLQHHVERVKMRIAKGGHAVPDDKIRKRYRLSLEQLPWFLEQADVAWLLDNSGAIPQLIGQKQDGTIILDVEVLPEIAAAAEKIATI